VTAVPPTDPVKPYPVVHNIPIGKETVFGLNAVIN